MDECDRKFERELAAAAHMTVDELRKFMARPTGRQKGRPKVLDGEFRTASVRLPVALLSRLDAICDQEGVTRSEWLRRAVEKALNSVDVC